MTVYLCPVYSERVGVCTSVETALLGVVLNCEGIIAAGTASQT